MKYIIFMLAAVFTQYTHASETITWQSLKPLTTQYQEISPANKALINEIYAYEVAQKSRQLSPAEMDGYNQRVLLAQKFNLNVRELLEQIENSELEAHNTVSELAAEDIKLTGYLVPLAFENKTGTQFVLVPTAGACSHTAPAPASQTVLVNFPEGYELPSLYTRVLIKGDIKAGSATTSVALSDGNQIRDTGYMINATAIETYQ
ncbi:DUF3299 domain-containing protein [Shewanella donghaensis]|uniref:DUF3299 domain-containing protein n=1 Tax=Shewanella donghaensis TaxID=238836 RepID=UPI001181F6E7|nr:DUF3299 domain-containing protein [Shewanella donghaensis]